MADSLDEFFAKKDKNKKGKKKNVKPDDIARELEEGKKYEKIKKDKDKSGSLSSGILNSNILEQQDEEWHDFEEEKEKDYTGLRIQTLSIKDKEDELREQLLQENGEDNKKENLSAWKVPSQPIEEKDDEPQYEEEKVVVEEVKKSNPVSAGKYVPPHLRSQSNQSLAPVSLASTKKSKLVDNKAPQIGDAAEFPSLGASGTSIDTNTINNDKDLKGFQPVKHGSKETIQSTTSHVLLDNKFSALSNSSSRSNSNDKLNSQNFSN